MPSAKQTSGTRGSSLLSANELKFMNEKVSGLLYLCNPLANKACEKTACFWYSWKNGHDDNSWFPCYKTCFEEYAARDAEGNPIVWPEGTASPEAIEAMKQYEQENKRRYSEAQADEAGGREQYKKP